MGSEILVTGGAGFIGSHVVDDLIKKGHRVTVLDDLSGGLQKNVNREAKFVRGSIVNSKLVDELVRGKEYVYHLAAYAAEGLSHFIRGYNYQNNLIGSINLINAAIRSNVRGFLFTSSLAVYGKGDPPFSEDSPTNPEDPYGIAKLAVERDLECAHRLFGLNYVIIRPHNVYGERQFLGDPYRNVIGIFMNRIMNNETIQIFGDGEQTRAFSYVGDIAPCIVDSLFRESARNQVINLGAKKPYSVNQLAEMVIAAMGGEDNVRLEHLPERFEVKHAHCTTEKSERLLGFRDRTSLNEGLRKMAEWAKRVGPMDPIVWEDYEVHDKLPSSWKNLASRFPASKTRINPYKY